MVDRENEDESEYPDLSETIIPLLLNAEPPRAPEEIRTAVFVDVQNISSFLEERDREIDFLKFRDFLRQYFSPLRIFFHCINFAYVGEDKGSAEKRSQWQRYANAVTRAGFTLRPKRAVEVNTSTGRQVKGNQDVELTADLIIYCLQNDMNRIVLMSGDSDFGYLMKIFSGAPFYHHTILLAPYASLAEYKESATIYFPLDDMYAAFSRPRPSRKESGSSHHSPTT